LALDWTAESIHIVYRALKVSTLSGALTLAFEQARAPWPFWLTGSQSFIGCSGSPSFLQPNQRAIAKQGVRGDQQIVRTIQ
jgi:hypothetical protein